MKCLKCGYSWYGWKDHEYKRNICPNCHSYSIVEMDLYTDIKNKADRNILEGILEISRIPNISINKKYLMILRIVEEKLNK